MTVKRRDPEPVLLGSLEEQVMLAVVRTEDEAYGMNVRRELEAVTGREVTIGSVYATLDRLEAKGFVFSRVDRRCGVAPRLRGDASGRSIVGADARDARAAVDGRQPSGTDTVVSAVQLGLP